MITAYEVSKNPGAVHPDRFRPRGAANPVRYCEPA